MAYEPQHDFWGTLSAVALAIVGVAILALVVSRNSNTTGVIQATGQAFQASLATAISPVTGSPGNSMYPSVASAYPSIASAYPFG